MIAGIESIYQRIADSIVDGIHEPWSSAKIEAVFYPNSSDYTGEFLATTGKSKGLEVTKEHCRAFSELRRKFKEEAGQPVWGQACFEPQSDGKFNMNWGYENCDKNGDTIWDADECSRRHEERRLRLNRQ